MGLESPQSGEINLQGKDIASLKPEKLALSISFVTTDKVRIANLRCKDVVALGRAPYTNWLGQLQPEDRKIVDNAIQLVGMSGYAEKTMDKMSDGECQRIMIARALAQDTPVILLDEPTNNLDIYHATNLMRIVRRLCDELGKTVILVLHEINYAAFYSDYICAFVNGKIAKSAGIKKTSPTTSFLKSNSSSRLKSTLTTF